MIAAAVTAVALATSAVAVSVAVQDHSGIHLGTVGIEIETLSPPTEGGDSASDTAIDGGETSTPAETGGAGSPPAPEDVPAPSSAEPTPEPEPIETVPPAPASPVPAHAANGRPESPGSSSEHKPDQ